MNLLIIDSVRYNKENLQQEFINHFFINSIEVLSTVMLLFERAIFQIWSIFFYIDWKSIDFFCNCFYLLLLNYCREINVQFSSIRFIIEKFVFYLYFKRVIFAHYVCNSLIHNVYTRFEIFRSFAFRWT